MGYSDYNVPALGHAWLQHGYIFAAYDEGNLVDKVHVLYICSICDEEYKDYDGVGPSDAGGNDGEDSGGNPSGTPSIPLNLSLA